MEESSENSVVGIFEAIGDLETVLTRLRSVAPELVAEHEQLQTVQEGLIDDTLDRGDDIALDHALDAPDVDDTDDVVTLPGSDVPTEDSSALSQPAANEVGAGPLSKQVWRKIFKKRPRQRKKYLCATRPKLKRTRKGKQVWYSMIRYQRADGSKGQLFRIVGRDPHKRPQVVHIGGKKLRWC
jgi:hypothetical protein